MNAGLTPGRSIYADPQLVESLEDCDFYHTMDIPGVGQVNGHWDLRGSEKRYLGGVDFKGKRVLEVGSASGFLTFWMEREGAEVVGYDLCPGCPWDIVPFAGEDQAAVEAEIDKGIGRMNNGFWLVHRSLGSKVRVVYGSVYDIPDEIGTVDIATLCATLVHFQNPFLALERAARLARETVVVTEMVSRKLLAGWMLTRFLRPGMRFWPDYRECATWPAAILAERCEQSLRWWALPPDIVCQFLGVLGFRKTEVTYHQQNYMGLPGVDGKVWRARKIPGFTVVGHRTSGIPGG